MDNLYAKPVMIQYIRDRFPEDLCIVAPDAGGVERARAYAKPFKVILPSSTRGASGPTSPTSCTSSET